MDFPERHRWDLTPSEAVALQGELARSVDAAKPVRPWKTVAAADVSFNRFDPRLFATVLLLDAESFDVIEQVGVMREVTFPYVPGLLSFREAPVILEAFRHLRGVPDVVICDGQGVAHPRGVGLATHVGLWLGLPTVGCAKTKLCGRSDEPGPDRGDRAPLVVGGAARGAVLRTRKGVKPVFVSPGHLCDVEGAVKVVLATAPRYRLPEPIRLAHDRVNALRRAAGPRDSPSDVA